MILRKCAVKACGAMVLIVNVGGQPYPVNPAETELAIPDGEGEFRLVKGYRPHGGTCVDIAARIEAAKTISTGK